MVQPKYSPEEALERVKLMMKYDSSLTLTENKISLSEQPLASPEAVAGTTLGAIAGGMYAGAAAGTAAFPVVGTAVGALVGLGLGVLSHWWSNKDYGEEGFKEVMKACSAVGVNNLVPKLTPQQIREIAYQIKDAKGDWNDDEESIKLALEKIPTIADLCLVNKRIPGGLYEFLNNLTDSPSEWEMFTRPLADMIEDSTVILPTPVENKKGKVSDNKKTTKPRGAKYIPCSGTYYETCYSPVIEKVQRCLGFTGNRPYYIDGKFGPTTAAALKAKGYTTFTDADVNKICGGTEVTVDSEISGEEYTDFNTL